MVDLVICKSIFIDRTHWFYIDESVRILLNHAITWHCLSVHCTIGVIGQVSHVIVITSLEMFPLLILLALAVCIWMSTNVIYVSSQIWKKWDSPVLSLVCKGNLTAVRRFNEFHYATQSASLNDIRPQMYTNTNFSEYLLFIQFYYFY